MPLGVQSMLDATGTVTACEHMSLDNVASLSISETTRTRDKSRRKGVSRRRPAARIRRRRHLFGVVSLGVGVHPSAQVPQVPPHLRLIHSGIRRSYPPIWPANFDWCQILRSSFHLAPLSITWRGLIQHLPSRPCHGSALDHMLAFFISELLLAEVKRLHHAGLARLIY
jgi:hypothetical protein